MRKTAEDFIRDLFGEDAVPHRAPSKEEYPLTSEALADAFSYAMNHQGLDEDDLTEMISHAFQMVQQEIEEKRKQKMDRLTKMEDELSAKLEKIKAQKEELV